MDESCHNFISESGLFTLQCLYRYGFKKHPIHAWMYKYFCNHVGNCWYLVAGDDHYFFFLTAGI